MHLPLSLCPDALHFPVEDITKKREIYNTVTIENNSAKRLSFKVKTTHPRLLLAHPRTGILDPGTATQVELRWTYETEVTDFQTFSQLQPKSRPKVAVEYFEPASSASPAGLAWLKVCFDMPPPLSLYHFTVDGTRYRSPMLPSARKLQNHQCAADTSTDGSSPSCNTLKSSMKQPKAFESTPYTTNKTSRRARFRDELHDEGAALEAPPRPDSGPVCPIC
eukprot:TRINITY_DN96060_c0_g1_i1.p1 TRINITY_DN96060_c0_g1~~TRINITY_DN96060_c0_g1_i1.p1  ORF type:complete len:238 (-),score=30.99 TRINITY_DN96060_c0_g1_i1:113-775(-)